MANQWRRTTRKSFSSHSLLGFSSQRESPNLWKMNSTLYFLAINKGWCLIISISETLKQTPSSWCHASWRMVFGQRGVVSVAYLGSQMSWSGSEVEMRGKRTMRREVSNGLSNWGLSIFNELCGCFGRVGSYILFRCERADFQVLLSKGVAWNGAWGVLVTGRKRLLSATCRANSPNPCVCDCPVAPNYGESEGSGSLDWLIGLDSHNTSCCQRLKLFRLQEEVLFCLADSEEKGSIADLREKLHY